MSLPRVTEILETLAPVSVAPADYTTTDSYADIGLIDAQGKTRVVYTIYNAHAANVIKWRVDGSVDGVTWIELKAEATLNGVTASSWVASATETSYRYFRMQTKSSVGATPGTARVRGYAKM